MVMSFGVIFFFKQKTAYEMRISDWSSDVCSSDLLADEDVAGAHLGTDADDAALVEVGEQVGAHVREVPGDLLLAELGVAGIHLVLLDVDRREIGRASCRERVCQYV